MTRRELLAAAASPASAAAPRPNVLLVMTDTHRVDAIAAHGNSAILTPNFDRLAGCGARFTNCWSQHPVCMRRQRTQSYGEVTFIDDALGDILKTLEETGLRGNTLIVFLSGHGDMLGGHGLFFKGPYHFRQCASVPLIVNFPGRVRQGKVVDGFVQQTDIMPAILALAGLDVPPGVQGRSQAPALTGTIRTRDWRLSYYPKLQTGELYDLAADPEEYVNLWDDTRLRAERSRMKELLLDRVLAARDPLPLREMPY